MMKKNKKETGLKIKDKSKIKVEAKVEKEKDLEKIFEVSYLSCHEIKNHFKAKGEDEAKFKFCKEWNLDYRGHHHKLKVREILKK